MPTVASASINHGALVSLCVAISSPGPAALVRPRVLEGCVMGPPSVAGPSHRRPLPASRAARPASRVEGTSRTGPLSSRPGPKARSADSSGTVTAPPRVADGHGEELPVMRWAGLAQRSQGQDVAADAGVHHGDLGLRQLRLELRARRV